MSRQYYDRGGPPGGIPEYDSRVPPRRPPPGSHASFDRPRAPPPLRPTPPGGARPGGDYQMRPRPPHPYAQPAAVDSAESLYDGSAYGGADDEEAETWPLPAPPFANPPRSRSPTGSPRGPPPQSPSSPRRPPQRPQRPDYQEPVLDPPRPGRVAPANRTYHQGPPPPAFQHGSGQWTGEGYRSPQPLPFAPSKQSRPPPPQSIPDYQYPQALQQAVYSQRNQRPPLGPPPSSRRGPASYYPQIAPVHPIVEETDSMRGSIRNANAANDGTHSSFGSSNIPIGIPGSYVEDRGSAYSLPRQARKPSLDEPPINPIQESSRESARDRESPSPEPAALIRQASLGKKSKPTLTTVKSGEKVKKDSPPQTQGIGSLPSEQPQQQARRVPPSASEKEVERFRPSVSDYGDDDDMSAMDKALEAGAGVAAAAAISARNDKQKPARPKLRTRESDILSSGTGFLDDSSSESEKTAKNKKKTSKQLFAAALPKDHERRSTSRSPLAPSPSVENEILGGASKGDGSATPKSGSKEHLPLPTAGLGDRKGQRRPPRLNVDAVHDAETRGSLTSLPDLIARATRLAGNLDRGKTASRLGMSFFAADAGSESDQERYKRSVADSANGNGNRRSGSISDILASFPPPGIPGSRGGAEASSLSRWSSNLRHSQLPSDSDAGEIRRKKSRKCCGMPRWLFLMLLLAVLLLVAAAVLVPVMLLVVIPNAHHHDASTNAVDTSKELQSCHAKMQCLHGGTNILSRTGFCRCVCVNGYTGDTCSTLSRAGCTTMTVGGTSHATVGDRIPGLLKAAEKDYGIPLDGETLLGLFSAADMSCSGENALVTFSNDVQQQAARTRESKRSSTVTSNNGGSPTPSSDSALDFARTAILYIFQASTSARAAATAQENLQAYFSSSSGGETQTDARTVSLGGGWSCDIPALSLRMENGTVVGGGK